MSSAPMKVIWVIDCQWPLLDKSDRALLLGLVHCFLIFAVIPSRPFLLPIDTYCKKRLQRTIPFVCVQVGYQYSIGVNIAFSGVNSRFLTSSRFPAFHLKYHAFLCISSWKMRSMRCAQRQLALRGLGKQLPVVRKANSLCKFVKIECVCFQST